VVLFGVDEGVYPPIPKEPPQWRMKPDRAEEQNMRGWKKWLEKSFRPEPH